LFKQNQSSAGWITLTIGTAVLTIPFIFLLKSLASSLRIIAHKLDAIVNPPAAEEPKT